MRTKIALSMAVFGLLAVSPIAVQIGAQEKPKPTVKIPEAGVPQIATIEGNFVRAAYNNEGYAILGYQIANLSVGEEWMLLDFGATIMDGVKNQKMLRDAISLETPDGTKLALASVQDYRAANLRALENRARVTRDSINYFPPMATQPCRIGFFSDVASPAIAWDQVELSDNRACLGRLFFKVPGGIKYGQHWLDVKFENSLVRVPFRILTKEEEKLLSKNFKDIRKQVKEAFSPKKKTQ
ncbi:MAG TPA: hypothetical protein VF147_00200 [Vicinamibacterales bacterium]